MKKSFYSFLLIFVITVGVVRSQSDWIWQSPTPNGNWLTSTKFVNANTGWVVGYFTLMKTTNGGVNWVNQSIPGANTGYTMGY